VTGPTGLKHDNGGDYLFSGSRDGTLKRWELGVDGAVCGATFESHVDWVSIHPIALPLATLSLVRRTGVATVFVLFCDLMLTKISNRNSWQVVDSVSMPAAVNTRHS